MGKDILVIGNTGHSRVTCVQWRSPFPNVEDFDEVILDMSSLDQATYDHIYRNERVKLENLRDQLTKMIDTNRQVYCIFSESVEPIRSPYAPKARFDSGEPYSSNEWLPVWPTIKSFQVSSTMDVVDHTFDKYFEGLDEWQYQIEALSSNYYSFTAIAVNKSREAIACRATKVIPGVEKHKGIVFLPKLTKYSAKEAIEILLDLALIGRMEAEYPWRTSIVVPGLSEIQNKIERFEKQINRINKRIANAKKMYESVESYRDLFSVDDELQVRAVRRVLSDIGIESHVTKPHFVVDLLGKEVAVEVTSDAGKISKKSDSLTQLVTFIQKGRKSEKVVFVANTYSRLPLEKRVDKENFTRETKEFLDTFSVCYVTARCLYLLWEKVQRGRISVKNARSLLLETSGELTDNMI